MQYVKITRPSVATGRPVARTMILVRDCTTYTGTEQGRPVWLAHVADGPETLEVLSAEEQATIVTVTPPADRKPGMDGSTGRCFTCDSRQCGPTCSAQEGYVYVAGKGWTSADLAGGYERQGRRVHWDEVWTEADGGHVITQDAWLATHPA